jgi:hypothetical protein
MKSSVSGDKDLQEKDMRLATVPMYLKFSVTLE